MKFLKTAMSTWAQIVATNEDHPTPWEAVAPEPSPEPEEEVPVDEEEEEPSYEELEDLSVGLGKLWKLGEKCHPGRDYKLDLQGYATRHVGDHARYPLFSSVDESILRKPTYAAFLSLLDNYEREAGKKEKVTSSEKEEESKFLDLVLNSKAMRYCHRYCVAKKVAPASRSSFKKLLGSLWFQQYISQKGGQPDSSGFEHVFVGEERDGEIVGLHNWLQLYIEEKKGTLDYYGYISHNRQRPCEDQPILSLQFAWTDSEDGSIDTKPNTTSIIGSSPELELAMYTLAALCGSKNHNTRHEHGKEITRCTLTFANDDDASVDIEINCVKWNVRGHPTIRTCYPSS